MKKPVTTLGSPGTVVPQLPSRYRSEIPVVTWNSKLPALLLHYTAGFFISSVLLFS